MNNCKNPPHYPPHCGCPPGAAWLAADKLLADLGQPVPPVPADEQH